VDEYFNSRGEGGSFEQGALLNKLNILPSVESTCHYFCISRVVPLLSSWHPLSRQFSV